MSQPPPPASTHPALEAFLRRLLLHSPLGAEERQAILGMAGQPAQVAAKRDLVIPAETVRCAILVADGMLGRFDLMKNGARQITALHIPGDMCDLHSVVAPKTGWGITALSAATIFNVPHGELTRVAERYYDIAMAFWRDTVLDASVLAKWVSNIGRKDARARLAHLLCEMGIRTERAGRGRRDAYGFDLTQEQLGDVVGLTPVHVNRTLRGLRHEGLVTIKGRTVEILDWNGLTAAAEFSATFLLLDEKRYPLSGRV